MPIKEEDLVTQVCMLESHLDGMIERAQRNEATLKRFHDLEMRLLSLNSLRELIEHILQSVQLAFKLESLSLALADKDGEIKQFLTEDGLRFSDHKNLVLVSKIALFKEKLGTTQQVFLGQSDDVLPEEFWSTEIIKPKTVAIIPLLRRGVYLGCIVLGSQETARFQPNMDTYFLERMSNVLSVCLENTLNYEHLRRSSLFDTLTGVNNRRFFEQRIEEEILRSLRTGDNLTCLFIDIDFFKKVNDTYGHQVGDVALKHVADLLKSQLRSNDILARYGGEEFVALLPTASEEKGMEVAERMRSCVAASALMMTNDQMVDITVSLGLSTFVVPQLGALKEIDGKVLVDMADKALYLAKKAGRNCVMSGGELSALTNATLANKQA